MSDYERHPLSALWGNIPEAEFAEMVEEFRSPTRQMIMLYEDKILDGWHRYLMCLPGSSPSLTHCRKAKTRWASSLPATLTGGI